jgi:5-methylcytosine-specific restriction endonuclease McrA
MSGPTRLARPCAVAYCPEPAGRGGRCQAHMTVHRQMVNHQFDERLYRTARWRRLRQVVLEEQGYFCAEPGCPRLAEEVHHKVKRADDLSLFHDRQNLVAYCRPCHAARTRRGE